MGELERLLKVSSKNLFPLPQTGKDILETFLLKSENEISSLVEKNTELSLLILSIANQPKFKMDNPPVEDIKLAVLLLGEDLVKTLILSYISTKLCKVTFNEFNFRLFWARAIANLCFSSLLSSQIKNYSSHLHISSYLMDFGIIVLYHLFPEDYLKVLKLKTLGKSTCEAENEIFNTTHATVGGEYFEFYNFPRRFILNIKHHHNLNSLPEDFPPEIKEDIKILHLIDLGVGSYFSINRERKFKKFKELAQNEFNFSKNLAESLIDSLPEQVNPFYEFLGYKEFILTPYSKWAKEQEKEIEKLKEAKNRGKFDRVLSGRNS